MHKKFKDRERRDSLKQLVKDLSATMSGRLANGERRKLNPIAQKVMERAIFQLLASGGLPIAMEISEKEALAFYIDERTPGERTQGARYAIAAAINGEGFPYIIPPVCTFPTGDPAPTPERLAAAAERAAMGVLFHGPAPHRPHVYAEAVGAPRATG